MRTGHVIPSSELLERCSRDNRFSDQVAKALWRYLMHDWGDVTEEERNVNERALRHRMGLFARYEIDGETIVITTDECRLTTAIMLESER